MEHHLFCARPRTRPWGQQVSSHTCCHHTPAGARESVRQGELGSWAIVGGGGWRGLGGSLLTPPALRPLQMNLWTSDTWACFLVHRAISLPWPLAIFMEASLLFLLMENQAQKGERFAHGCMVGCGGFRITWGTPGLGPPSH